MKRDSGVSIVGGLAMGAAAMYFLDPRSGRGRRARARDRIIHTLNVAENELGRMMEDAGNRAQGTVARTRRFLTPEEIVDDQRLEARVRSILGRLTSATGAVTVTAREGIVTLTGQVLEAELGYVLTGIRRVNGVRRLESRLTTVKQFASGKPASIERSRRGMPPDLLQNSMSPTSRLIVGTTGVALAVGGARKGGFFGVATAMMGGLLVARAVTNTSTTLSPGGRPSAGVSVNKTIDVEAPVRDVFAFWASFGNFPRFMQHVREVRENESGTSHWVADGPAGMAVAWDAEVTSLKRHERIAWKSLDGSTVTHAGEVRFEEVSADVTRIHVRMTYSPPGGAVGHAVATLFGADPKRQLDDDLGRFKTLLEAGRVRAHGQEVTRPEVEPAQESVPSES